MVYARVQETLTRIGNENAGRTGEQGPGAGTGAEDGKGKKGNGHTAEQKSAGNVGAHSKCQTDPTTSSNTRTIVHRTARCFVR